MHNWRVGQLHNDVHLLQSNKRCLLRLDKRGSAGKWLIRTWFEYCHHRISECHMCLLEKGVQGEFHGSIDII